MALSPCDQMGELKGIRFHVKLSGCHFPGNVCLIHWYLVVSLK